MVIVTWEIVLLAELSDFEIEAIADRASPNGILDYTIAQSRRIIVAETDEEETDIANIVAWLSETLFQTEDIGLIKLTKEYHPVFEDEEDGGEPEFIIELDS